jgi:hypothetical protein
MTQLYVALQPIYDDMAQLYVALPPFLRWRGDGSHANNYSLCPFLSCILGLVKVKLDKVWPNILLKI